MVDEKRKTTVPIPPVGAGGEQPILNNTTGIISGETPEIYYLEEISEENFQEIQRRLDRISNPAYLHTVTLSELYETSYPSRPPIIDGLLYPGTYLLAGAPKVGKSFLVASVLDVSPKAIDLPDIDSYIGLMHTFFALEDRYGLKIGEIDGELCLRLDKSKGSDYLNLFDMFISWQREAAKLEAGEITKEEYDQWRYKYPEFDNKPGWVKTVPSQGLNDLIVNALKENVD